MLGKILQTPMQEKWVDYIHNTLELKQKGWK